MNNKELADLFNGLRPWFIGLGLLIGVTIIVSWFYSFLTSNGILQSKLTVTMNDDEDIYIDAGDVTITLLGTDGEKEYTVVLDEEDASASVKLKRGDYYISVAYDGIRYYYAGVESINGVLGYTLSFDEYLLTYYAILLELSDTNGTAIEADEVEIRISDSEFEMTASRMSNGDYIALFLWSSDEEEGSMSGIMEIYVEGYEPIETEFSNLPRVTKVTAELEEAS